MSFRAILDHLSYDMGVPLVLDEQGKCKVFFQKRLEFYLGSNQNEDRFHVYGSVCALPEGTNRESLYASLLKAHAFGYASGGALFGVSQDTQEVLLFKEFNAQQVDYHDFLVALEKFVQSLDYWKEHATKLLQASLEKVLHEGAQAAPSTDQSASMQSGLFRV